MFEVFGTDFTVEDFGQQPGFGAMLLTLGFIFIVAIVALQIDAGAFVDKSESAPDFDDRADHESSTSEHRCFGHSPSMKPEKLWRPSGR